MRLIVGWEERVPYGLEYYAQRVGWVFYMRDPSSDAGWRREEEKGYLVRKLV